jgi:hypothetical protein
MNSAPSGLAILPMIFADWVNRWQLIVIHFMSIFGHHRPSNKPSLALAQTGHIPAPGQNPNQATSRSLSQMDPGAAC